MGRLTATGRAQAADNGRLLKDVAGDLSGFDFFASPTHRACCTMELARDGAGLAPTGYRADHRLMEIHFGDHTWMTLADVAATGRPPLTEQAWDDRIANGESWADVHARVGRFLETLMRDAVIVTHGGTARIVRGLCLGLPPGETKRYRPPHAGIMRLSRGTETYFGE